MTSQSRLIARCLTTIVVVALVVSPLSGMALAGIPTEHACCTRAVAEGHCQSVTVLQCCGAPERPDPLAVPASAAQNAAPPTAFAAAGPADLVPAPAVSCIAGSSGEARRFVDAPRLYLLHAVLLV